MDRIQHYRTRLAERWGAGLHTSKLWYGLRRDLNAEFSTPRARIPISIRELKGTDVPVLFPAETSHMSGQEQLEIRWRRSFLEEGFERCFVAVDERNGEPCYVQWLIGPESNDRLTARHFHRLAEDEALLENAYTPVHYRAKGVMPAAMAMIAERAREIGARRVTTFVHAENVPSLKGCWKAGFAPVLTREISSYFFESLHTVSIDEMDKTDPRYGTAFWANDGEAAKAA
jgi:RimJ/RimL family protein N-acetyltransferase